MISKNNYDINSKGIDIQGNFGYDSDLSQQYFRENFEKIDDDLFIYRTPDKIEIDVSFSVKGLKTDLIKYLNYVQGDFDWKLESKNELLDEVINNTNVSLSNYEDIAEDLKEYDIELITDTPIDYIITRGYSQGDYAKVLYFPKRLKELWGNDVNESSLKEEIDHLFWDFPIIANVVINGEEYHYEGDSYEWQREEFINQIMEKLKDSGMVLELVKSELESIVPQEIPYN